MTVIECPELEAPPPGALDALAEKAARDPEVGAWIIELDRHYQKLDACR